MKNLTLIVIAFIYLFSCSNAPTNPDVGHVTQDTHKEGVSFVNVIKNNFNDDEKQKAAKYIPVMDSVLKSKCFLDFMKERDIKKANGKSNEEVVAHILNSTVDIELIMYYKRFSKVHGYTLPDVNKIWLNRKYHNGASLCSEASNLAHELSHKIGYGHNYKSSVYRPFSVPYSINAGFKHCCK